MQRVTEFVKEKTGFISLQLTYTAQKKTQVFLGHIFFSVTETDETIKMYKEYSKMD